MGQESRAERLVPVLFAAVMISAAVTSGVVLGAEDPEPKLNSDLLERTSDAPPRLLQMAAVSVLEQSRRPETNRLRDAGRVPGRMTQPTKGETGHRQVTAPETVTATTDDYEGSYRVASADVFRNHSAAVRDLSALVGPDPTVDTRVATASELLTQADRGIARRSLEDARRAKAELPSDDETAAAVRRHVERAEAAFERAEALRPATDAPVTEEAVARRADAIDAYRRAWRHSQTAVTAAVEAETVSVTLFSRADPARTNVSGPISQRVAGNVSGVRPSNVGDVLVTVDGERTVEATLNRSSDPLGNTSFSAVVNRSTRTATINVTVIAPTEPSSGGESSTADDDDGDEADVVDVRAEPDGLVYVFNTTRGGSIQVNDAAAAEAVTAELSGTVDGEALTVTRVDLRTARDVTTYTTALETPTERLSGLPPLSDAEPLGYVRVGSTLDDANLSDATWHFRLDSAAMPDGATPGDVTVYRYAEGDWRPVETTHVGDGRYLATTSGQSTLAVGVPASRTATDEPAATAVTDAPTDASTPAATGETPADSTAPAELSPTPDSTQFSLGDGFLSDLVDSIVDFFDSIFGSVSPVRVAAADTGGVSAATDETVTPVTEDASGTAVRPQTDGDAVVLASTTLRVDADGLPDRYETSVTGTDPLDANSNSSLTATNESLTPPIDGVEDYDNDSLQTNREGLVGTDPFERDTDGDGLSDLVETVYDAYDPDDPDTNDDGISDANADRDGDGLTTIQEVTNGTAPFTADSDGDTLSDRREVAELPTDPTKRDTDNDGFTDAEEIAEFGTDPTDPDTDDDGVVDSNETFTTVVDDSATGVDVELSGSGDVAAGVTVTNASEAEFGTAPVESARVGPIVELDSERDFDTAELEIPYNRSAVSNPSNLSVFRYNETLQTFVPLPSEINVTSGTVSTTVTHFSTYTVFDERSWREYLESSTSYEPIRADRSETLPAADGEFVDIQSVDPSDYPQVSVFATVDTPAGRDGSLTTSNFSVYENGQSRRVDSVEFTEGTQTDVVFVFDDTGSMGGEIDSMKRNVRSFARGIEEEGIDARYALVSFKDNNEVDQRFTDDIDAFESSVDGLRASGGGDGPEDSLDAIYTGTTLDFREDAQKVVVHITDAASHGPGSAGFTSRTTTHTVDELERNMRRNGTLFYTISPDREFKTVDLADRVGGIFADIRSDSFDVLLEDLQSELTSRYRVTYQSCLPADGSGRRVDLYATTDGTTANRTGGYVAPDGEALDRCGGPRDSDGDGLNDSQELGGFKTGKEGVIRTDPYDADTDNDGIPDGEEIGASYNTSKVAPFRGSESVPPDTTIYTLNSNPVEVDSDGDGLTDAEELEEREVTYVPAGATEDAREQLLSEDGASESDLSGIVNTVTVTTDPYSEDTDGDGLDDGREETLGTNPRAEDTDGDNMDDAFELSSSDAGDPTLYDNSPPTVVSKQVWVEVIEDQEGFSQPFDDTDRKFHVRLRVRDPAGLQELRIVKGDGEYTETFSGDREFGYVTITQIYEGGNTLGNFIDQVNPIDFSTLSFDAVEDFENFVGAIKSLALGDKVFIRATDVNGNVEEGFHRGKGAIETLIDLFVEFSSKIPGIGDSIVNAVGAVVGFVDAFRGIGEGLFNIVTTTGGFLMKLATDPIGTIAGLLTDVVSGAVAVIETLATLSQDLLRTATVLFDLVISVAGGLVQSILRVGPQKNLNPFGPLPGGARDVLDFATSDLGAAARTFTAMMPTVGLFVDLNRNASFALGFYAGIILNQIIMALLTSGSSFAGGALAGVGGRVGSILSTLDDIPYLFRIVENVERAGDVAGEYSKLTGMIRGAQSSRFASIVGGTGLNVMLETGYGQLAATRTAVARGLVDDASEDTYSSLADLTRTPDASQAVPYLSRHESSGVSLLDADSVDTAEMEVLLSTDSAFSGAVARAYDRGEIDGDEAEQVLDTYDSLRERSLRSAVTAEVFETVVGATGVSGAKFAARLGPGEAELITDIRRSDDTIQYIQRTDGEGAPLLTALSSTQTETFLGYDGPREHLVRARLGNGVTDGAISADRAITTIQALDSLSGSDLTNATKNISEARTEERLRAVTERAVRDAGLSESMDPPSVDDRPEPGVETEREIDSLSASHGSSEEVLRSTTARPITASPATVDFFWSPPESRFHLGT